MKTIFRKRYPHHETETRRAWISVRIPPVVEAIKVNGGLTAEQITAKTGVAASLIPSVISEARRAGNKIYTIKCGQHGKAVYEFYE